MVRPQESYLREGLLEGFNDGIALGNPEIDGWEVGCNEG